MVTPPHLREFPIYPWHPPVEHGAIGTGDSQGRRQFAEPLAGALPEAMEHALFADGLTELFGMPRVDRDRLFVALRRSAEVFGRLLEGQHSVR